MSTTTDVTITATTLEPGVHEAPTGVPGAVRDRWARDDGSALVTEYLAHESSTDRVLAGARVRRRPHTASAVITGAFAVEGAARERAVEGIVERIVEDARSLGEPLIKWETLAVDELDPAGHGFRPLAQPHHSGAGTEPHILGWVRDLVEWPRAEHPYYRQTTEFTCGGAAALLALDAAGASLLGPDRRANRLAELDVWRTATNMPACDPYALATAVTRLAARHGARTVEVYLDTEGPVLLEHLDDADEIALRADLQELAALDLDALGVERHRSRLPMIDLARAVGDGAIALLLIDLTSLIDDPTPHWVTALSAHDELVLIDDPWVETSIGESWVVTHELVVRAEEFESIVTWGSGYRGVILLKP